MARNYATTPTAIWRPGSTFASLSIDAQWAHWMLTSQPDISAAGVLSINLRRWTNRARDADRDRLVPALRELGDEGWIVYDQDTEELWLRSFVEWDGGYNNRKRQPVIRSAALGIESAMVRRALAVELGRLGFTVDGLADRPSDSLSAEPDRLSDVPNPGPAKGYPGQAPTEPTASNDQGEYSQDNRLSDAPSRSDRVVVTEVVPLTTTLNPQSPPPPAGGAGGSATPKRARSDRGTRLPEDWAPSEGVLAWYREKKLGRVQLSAIVDLETQIEKFRNHWLAKSGKDATKRDWNRALQNWLIEAGERAQRYGANGAGNSPASNAPKPIPPDQRCPNHRGYPGGTRDDGEPRCGQCRAEAGSRRTRS